MDQGRTITAIAHALHYDRQTVQGSRGRRRPKRPRGGRIATRITSNRTLARRAHHGPGHLGSRANPDRCRWAHFLGTAWCHLPRGATPILSQRLAQDPLYRTAWTLTRHFHTIVAHRRGEQALAVWCRLAEASGIPAFAAFAGTLRHDWDAVVAGVTVEWSQGPVEGFNNRPKLLKRMM